MGKNKGETLSQKSIQEGTRYQGSGGGVDVGDGGVGLTVYLLKRSGCEKLKLVTEFAVRAGPVLGQG